MPRVRLLTSVFWFFGVLAVGCFLQGAEPPLREVIDREILAAYPAQNITPAAMSGDAEFLRRIYLDLVGSIPTWQETVEFLDSTEPAKRERLIDKLLADPRFAQQQADQWDGILFGRNPPGSETDKREGFQAWLKKQFAENVAYDVWMRELLRAEGTSTEKGAMFFVQYRNSPEDASEAISERVLGVQLQCARCHDHPYEDWKQRDFFGMAAFLSRLEVVTVGKKDAVTVFAIGEQDGGDIQFTGPAKDQKPGKKGEPIKPKFLLGDALAEPESPAGFKPVKFEANKPPPPPKFSRKDQFADWATKPENPFFAKAIANRVWGQFLGRGIVHPVIDLSPSKKPSHPALLEQLTKSLVEQKFDLKWYIRELVNSKTYQRSSVGGGEPLPEWFPHARMRPLSAEELAESWRIATGYALSESAKPDKTGRFRPLEGGYMLRYFGTPNSGTGDFQGGLQEHLYANNGPLSQMISGVKGGLAEYVGDAKQPLDERIDRLFLATLTRRPNDAERKKFGEFLTTEKASTADAVWTLLTCSEFRFNH